MDALLQEALDTARQAEGTANGAQAFAGITLTPIAALPTGAPNRVAFAVPGVKATAKVVPLRNVSDAIANLGDLVASVDAPNQQVFVASQSMADASRVQALVFDHG